MTDESTAMDHVVPKGAIDGVDLPKATIDALTSTGVPPVVKLPDWPGPTLFSSELGSGRLVTTTTDGALVRRTEPSYIIGAVRDINDQTPYSVFALAAGTGEVFLLDATNAEDDRFVASSVITFLATLDAFVTAWPHPHLIGSFRSLLEKLDPRTLESEHNYWPGWLEELE